MIRDSRLELSRSRGRRWGATAPAAVSAEERNRRDEESVDGSHRPRWEMAMTLLLPDPRPRMGLEQPQRWRCVDTCRFGGVELDAAEVLRADEAVLVGADQSGGRAMVTVEWKAIETLCDEYILREGVLDRHDRPVAVETAEDDVSDGRFRSNRRLDDHAIEGLERDSLPVQVGGGPASHAVKVGGELSAGKRRERRRWQSEGVRDGAADLDDSIGGDSGSGSGEVRTEAREPTDEALAGGKRHVGAPSQDAERVSALQFRSICRSIGGYTIRCRKGLIAAM